MNESNLKQNLKSEQNFQQDTITDFGKSDIFKGLNNYCVNVFQNNDAKENRGRGETGFSNNCSQLIQPWSSLIDSLCSAKSITMKFLVKNEVKLFLDGEDTSRYAFHFNACGGLLYQKDGKNQKEIAKIVGDLVFLQREGGKYERIGSIVNQIQCKKIKIIAWSQKTNSVFQTGSNSKVNMQVIPCCFPFYKIFRLFQKDEVIIKDKNTDVIYSTYSTKSLKNSKQSIFTFSNNLTNNIDKLLTLLTALQYIEILWFTRYYKNSSIQKL